MKRNLPYRLILLTFVCQMLLFSVPILGDNSAEQIPSLTPNVQEILKKGEGAVSDRDLAHIASKLSEKDFVAAIYGNQRSFRRIAIDAAGFSPQPLPLVPYLVSFMEAAERQAASAAANSVFMATEEMFNLMQNEILPLEKQSAQLQDMLLHVAHNSALEPDMRVEAIRLTQRLQPFIADVHRMKSEEWVGLLQDDSLEVREATLAGLSFPLTDELLSVVATAAESDISLRFRGAAVSMICENALFHQVTKPSADLENLVLTQFDKYKADGDNDGLMIAPILGCLAQFPYRARASLTDRINNCGNEKVIKYWKSLSQ